MIGLFVYEVKSSKEVQETFFFFFLGGVNVRFIGASNVDIPSKVLHIALIDYRDLTSKKFKFYNRLGVVNLISFPLSLT